MKSYFPQSVAVLSTMIACGTAKPPRSEVKATTNPSADSVNASFASTPSELFGLASTIQNSDRFETFKPYVGPGAAYLFFGEADKFRVETNLSIEARGGSGIVMGGDRYIRAAYFLDAYAFGRLLAKGQAVDIEAKADLNTSKLTLNVRALGNSLYYNEVNAAYDQSFIRDLVYKSDTPLDSLGIPIPGLGVIITGKIGGEIGLKAAPGLRADGAVSANFEPNVILHGSVAGGLSAFKFATVEAQGSAMLMNFRVSGSSDLGYSPFNNFIYGDAGFNGGSITALDGKLELIAKEDISAALPAGVSPLLWNLMGTTPEAKTWSHTLWDPAILYAAQVPARGTSFIKYINTPADCETSVASTKANLKSRLGKLEGQKPAAKGQEAVVLSSDIVSLGRVLSQLETYCAKIKDAPAGQTVEQAKHE
ncbi:MAG: hypothetical protein H7249_06300 [Chitinophagaceae bacterium]|nr:hypothetical protein [Oligoflexus sp.]